MIVVDHDKCTGCSFCVDECPARILAVTEGKAGVTHSELCFDCGHCAAICPKSAITSESESESRRFVARTIDPGLADIAALFHRKRSVRSFKSASISSEAMAEVLDYGELAPSAHNVRARKYYVIADKSQQEEVAALVVGEYKKLLKTLNPMVLFGISLWDKNAHAEISHMRDTFESIVEEYGHGYDSIFRSPSHVVCVAAPKQGAFSRDDCVGSQHYMMLFAKTKGIDSFIAGYAQWAHKALEKHLGVPKGYSIFAVSSFGYGKHEFKKELTYSRPEVIVR